MDILAAMRVFVRVVERGSMSNAARDLGVGQPAISERIERLEAYLGCQLLRRNTRALSVSDAGATFYERCKIAIDAADEALSAASIGIGVRGTLRIAAPHGFGEVVLTPLLPGLRAMHPGLQIDLILNDRVVDPVTEGVDISFRVGDRGDGHFIARKLGHISRVLVASPAYLAQHGKPTAPEMLAKHAFARVAGLFNDGRLPLLTVNQKAVEARVNPVITVSHWRALHRLVLDGGVIGVLQEPVCRDDLASGRLRCLLSGYTVPGFELRALYSVASPVPSRIRAAMSFFETEISTKLASF